MAITNTKLLALKPRAAIYRVADSNGLCIEVTPSGARLWRYRYRHNGKPSMLGLGTYPQTTLRQARRKRDDARDILATGVNPADARRTDVLAQRTSADNTFESVGREWIAKMQGRWTAHHSADVLRSMEQEAFPAIGHRPVAELESPEIMDCLRAIEARDAIEVAHRTAQRIASVCRHAVLTGRAKYNPAADLRGALKTRKVQHMTALPIDDVPAFLDKLDTYDGRPETALALRLVLLTFVRTEELRCARWDEFDIENARWDIPAERMKMREPHVVPLSSQTIGVLRELLRWTGGTPFLFPARSSLRKPMSNNTMLFAVYRLGYHGRATVHGFRSLASTTLNEQGWPPDVIERQLAHAERNKVRGAYNRAEYLPQRRKMMQAWADYLDALRAGANVVPIKRKAG
jgi:integrase